MAIEREVQEQYVDTRLAEETEIAAFDVGFDDLAHALLGNAARLGHARDLPQRSRGREMRIESAGRGGHELGGNGATRVGIFFLQLRHLCGDAVAQCRHV